MRWVRRKEQTPEKQSGNVAIMQKPCCKWPCMHALSSGARPYIYLLHLLSFCHPLYYTCVCLSPFLPRPLFALHHCPTVVPLPTLLLFYICFLETKNIFCTTCFQTICDKYGTHKTSSGLLGFQFSNPKYGLRY